MNTTSTSTKRKRQGMPPPHVFGVNERYTSWRDGQGEAVEWITDAKERYVMPICPTGFGKSLTYVVAGLINGGKVVVLTSTKALQDQLARDFKDVLVDIRGKDNYLCKLMGGMSTCAQGPCNWGMKCEMMKGGCEYYDRVRAAADGKCRVVSTNYAYWLNRKDWTGAGVQGDGEVRGVKFDVLVGDEGHELPEILSNFLTKEIKASDQFEGIKARIVESFPTRADGMKEWTGHWMKQAALRFESLAQEVKQGRFDPQMLKEIKWYEGILDALKFIKVGEEEDKENLVVYKTKPSRGNEVVTASVVWPYHYTESALLKGVGKVVITSATVTKKTLGLLGIDEDEVAVMEVDHPFALENRMLYHVPTIRLNFRTTPSEMKVWMAHIDLIIKSRLHLKGIVHSVSYTRQKYILDNSKHRGVMIGHDSKSTVETTQRFKSMSPPAVFVSPVMTTGYDFPDDECRWQIIGKLAYPDTTDPIIKKRMEMDNDYAPYIAMQRLVQTCGRGVRNEGDWCDNFIVDDNIKWFVGKYREFAPKWFRKSIQTVRSIPNPRA